MHIGILLHVRCSFATLYTLLQKAMSAIVAQPSSVHVFKLYITVLIHSIVRKMVMQAVRE